MRTDGTAILTVDRHYILVFRNIDQIDFGLPFSQILLFRSMSESLRVCSPVRSLFLGDDSHEQFACRSHYRHRLIGTRVFAYSCFFMDFCRDSSLFS